MTTRSTPAAEPWKCSTSSTPISSGCATKQKKKEQQNQKSYKTNHAASRWSGHANTASHWRISTVPDARLPRSAQSARGPVDSIGQSDWTDDGSAEIEHRLLAIFHAVRVYRVHIA